MATTESEANAAVATAEAGSESAGSVASAAESAESEGIESADPVDAEELKVSLERVVSCAVGVSLLLPLAVSCGGQCYARARPPNRRLV